MATYEENVQEFGEDTVLKTALFEVESFSASYHLDTNLLIAAHDIYNHLHQQGLCPEWDKFGEFMNKFKQINDL
jgi:hypothetical protein